MARYQVIYWREIPSLVEAFENAETFRLPLSSRFQELIDIVAMKVSATEVESYLDGWRQGPVASREGSAEAVAREVAAEIEASYPFLREQHLSNSS